MKNMRMLLSRLLNHNEIDRIYRRTKCQPIRKNDKKFMWFRRCKENERRLLFYYRWFFKIYSFRNQKIRLFIPFLCVLTFYIKSFNQKNGSWSSVYESILHLHVIINFTYFVVHSTWNSLRGRFRLHVRMKYFHTLDTSP